MELLLAAIVVLLVACIALGVAALVALKGSRVAHAEASSQTADAVQRLTHQLDRERAVEAQQLEALERSLTQVRAEMADLRGQTLQQLAAQQSALLAQLSEADKRMAEVRSTLDSQLKSLQADNSAQLERMRATVDEKLQKTLNDRITQSFQLVNERLQQVDRGLGEMRTIAQDVGGLKKVLSGVKTRGIVGEVQLGAILKEILSPGQYEENVATVPGSAERVEFAVKLPGEDGETVHLPIDAKFPGDAYEHLQDAQESGDAEAVEAAWKALETRLRSEAKDIGDKYLAPPATTTFGILFLPFEGLYAEVAGRRGLIERLQRDCRVNVAGPSTMAALLNSLQMGFQTVAIQKRANEIQEVLAAVKTEFGKYQDMLRRAQKQLGTASKTIDTLVGTRSRAMERRLRGITELGSLAEADAVLGIESDEGDGLDDAPAEPESARPESAV